MELELPVNLEWLGQPSKQDIIDLDKLYGDAPQSWISDASLGSNWALEKTQQGNQVALGRFNDRIVCAAILVGQSEISDSTYDYQIDQICVREVTRERGVAKQLMVRIVQWAKAHEKSLYIEGDDPRLNGLYELGFTQYLQGWRYMPL